MNRHPILIPGGLDLTLKVDFLPSLSAAGSNKDASSSEPTFSRIIRKELKADLISFPLVDTAMAEVRAN